MLKINKLPTTAGTIKLINHIPAVVKVIPSSLAL